MTVRTMPGRGALLEIVRTLALTLVIFLLVQTFVAQPFRVEGPSMEATLLPDQNVLIDKLTPRWSPYRLGDIVVLQPPAGWSGSNGIPFIKRVIGVGGDRIELHDGAVWVNGTKLAEPYVFLENGVSQPSEPSPGGASEWLVPVGDLFVMGDHRGESADSRVFGPIPVSSVIGRAWLRYLPLDRFGTLS
jgi:signal peptidase I